VNTKDKVWKVLKEVKKNWSHELKRPTITTKRKVAKVKAEPKTTQTCL